MSKDVLTVGTLSAPHGEKRYGVNEFLVEGLPYRLPMWLINGAGEGPTLVVTAGVHAAEYASIAAALELGRSLDPGGLSGRVMVVPVVNMPTFCAASVAGIPSILAEAGGQGIWTVEDVRQHTNGLNRLMRHLKMIPGGAPDRVPFTLLERFLWLRSDHEGFWYPAIAVNDRVKAGQNLGFVKDCEGHVLQTPISPADGIVLFIVSSLAINRTDPSLAVGA